MSKRIAYSRPQVRSQARHVIAPNQLPAGSSWPQQRSPLPKSLPSELQVTRMQQLDSGVMQTLNLRAKQAASRPPSDASQHITRVGQSFDRGQTQPTQAIALQRKPAHLTQQPLKTQIQKKDPESEQQAENAFGERNYLRISNAQQKLIDTFCAGAHADIEAWTALRSMHTGGPIDTDYDSYIKDLRSLDRQMNKRFAKFKRDFLQKTPTITTLETDLSGWGMTGHEHEIPFHAHTLAKDEVFRQLNAGFFQQYLKEIRTLHGIEASLYEYSDLFREYGALNINRKAHHYDLITIFGAEGGAGEGLTGGVNLKGFTIKYSNDLGMKWKVDTWGGAGRLGAGVSLSPIEANIESSLGSTEINAGSADEWKYYPPNYFDYNLVKLAGGGATMGGGYAVGTLSMGEVDFNTSGLVAKVGTADVGEAGFEVGLGFTVGGDPYDYEGLGEAEKQEVQPREGNWTAVMRAKVHFRSAENALDDADIATIQQVIGSILNHEKHYPGDTFKIYVLGTATERWLSPNKSAAEQGVDVSDINDEASLSRNEKQQKKGERLNHKLAGERANIVFNELSSQIQGQATSFTPGVLDQVEWAHEGKILPRDPSDEAASDNAPTNRGAVISIYYNTTPEGNVSYGK